MITESGVNIEELKNKIINGEKLSEEEVKNIVYEDLFYQVDRVEGEDHRWARKFDLIFQSNSTYGYYLLPWIKCKYPNIPIIDYIHIEEW